MHSLTGTYSIRHLRPLFRSLSFVLLAGVMGIGSCKKKGPDLSDAIWSIKETGILVTSEYTLTKIIKANDNKTWYKIGDRKILMSCEAHVKAGINLQQLTPKNFNLTDSVLSVKLPKAQLVSLNIPPEKIQLQYQDLDLFREPFTAAERELLLAQAENEIKRLINNLGILKTAEANGEVYIQSLLQQSGFKNVTVSFE